MKPPDQVAAEHKSSEESRAYQDIHIAGEAKAVLEMPAFKRAIERVREGIWREFKSTKSDDLAALSRSRVKIEVIEEILTELVDEKTKGDEAERELGMIGKAREFIRKRGYLDR